MKTQSFRDSAGVENQGDFFFRRVEHESVKGGDFYSCIVTKKILIKLGFIATGLVVLKRSYLGKK